MDCHKFALLFAFFVCVNLEEKNGNFGNKLNYFLAFDNLHGDFPICWVNFPQKNIGCEKRNFCMSG